MWAAQLTLWLWAGLENKARICNLMNSQSILQTHDCADLLRLLPIHIHWQCQIKVAFVELHESWILAKISKVTIFCGFVTYVRTYDTYIFCGWVHSRMWTSVNWLWKAQRISQISADNCGVCAGCNQIKWHSEPCLTLHSWHCDCGQGWGRHRMAYGLHVEAYKRHTYIPTYVCAYVRIYRHVHMRVQVELFMLQAGSHTVLERWLFMLWWMYIS